MGPLGQSHLARGERFEEGALNISWSGKALRREGVDNKGRKSPHACQAAQDECQNLVSTDIRTWRSSGLWPRTMSLLLVSFSVLFWDAPILDFLTCFPKCSVARVKRSTRGFEQNLSH